MVKIAVLADFLEEKWTSMDLVAEQLSAHLSQLPNTNSELVRRQLRTRFAGRPIAGLERALGRFAQLPLELATTARPHADFFHVADHSYAHLALLFPRARSGVFCHDIDAFRALLPGSGARPSRRLLSRLLLTGLQHARVVFHSTDAVRREIIEHRLVPESRLVQAPYGVAREFLALPRQSPSQPAYVLHVGSCVPRKNIAFLLRVFATCLAQRRDLRLVQIGGTWTDEQKRLLETLALSANVEQRRGISRAELAVLYARSSVVCVPSLREGFGLPVIEALACGAPVVASDLPVLREVGFEGARFCAIDDVAAWQHAIDALLTSEERPGEATRDRIRARYTWEAHAQTVARAYASV